MEHTIVTNYLIIIVLNTYLNILLDLINNNVVSIIEETQSKVKRLQTISEIFPKEPCQNGSTPKFLDKPILTLDGVNPFPPCRLLN